MKNKLTIRILSLILASTIAISLLVGCNSDKSTDGDNVALPQPDTSASVSPTASPEGDADVEEVEESIPESTEYIAKIGDAPVYECDFTRFFSMALSDAVQNEENLYNDDMTSEEVSVALSAFLNKKPVDSEKTNREIIVEKALFACHTYNVAAKIAKDKNLLTEEEVTNIEDTFDATADSYGEHYGLTRDEFAEYVFSMSANDARRFAVNQEYAKAHMDDWLKEKGYALTVEKPVEPEKPTSPGDDASPSAQEAYNAKMKLYTEEYAEYEKDLETYNTESAKYWEKYRADYNKEDYNYKIASVRYLYVSTLDEDGKELTEDKKKEKYDNALLYMKLVNDMGLDFANIVKGFSESKNEDNGFCDIDITGSGSTLNSTIVEWAINTSKVSKTLKLFEEDDGYYIVQIVGVVDFDKIEGEVASEETTPELVKKAVEDVITTAIYNEYAETLTEQKEYALDGLNNKRVEELVNNYLESIGQ